MSSIGCLITESSHGAIESTAGYVYLICDPANNYFKIGVTRGKTKRRIEKLQTGNPTELHAVAIYHTNYPFRLESMLHSHYATSKVMNEWFEIDSVRQWLDDCIMLENNIYCMLDNPFFAKGLK